MVELEPKPDFLGAGSKYVIQIIKCFSCFLDQIFLETESKSSRCWNQKIRFPEPKPEI